MGYSGIGGQAVMEGVMMKNGIHYAVAVRKPDKEIVVDAREYPGIVKNQKIKKIPILRGVINFIDSLVLGMRTLMYSASFFDEEAKELSEEEQKAKEKKESVAMGFTVFLSVILALVIFIVASLTDMLDGKIARKYNLVTNFGKFMDPLADKLLVCSAMICLVDLRLLPSWIVIIIIAREFIISGFRLIAAEHQIVIAASMWGKFKTTFQMAMIILIILNINVDFYMSAWSMYWH